MKLQTVSNIQREDIARVSEPSSLYLQLKYVLCVVCTYTYTSVYIHMHVHKPEV